MNFKEDNIKKIIFNNNNNNSDNVKSIIFSNNENNVENVIFNDDNKNNIEKFMFEDQNIIIEENIAIKNSDILYKDDIVYLKELEHQLLSEYPVDKQSLKYIQKEVEEVASKIINTKNIGVKNYEMFKKGIEYTFINEIINDKFKESYIIPIVLDKHKIYAKLNLEKENIENNDDQNIYFSESLEDKKGIIDENQRTQMVNLKILFHDRALDKLSYKEYINKVDEIMNPYITKYDNNSGIIGHIKKPKNDTMVLRYYDLESIYWDTYKIKNDYVTSKDIFDEVGKIKGVEDDILIKGDELNIVGFMIVPENNGLIKKNFIKNNIITKITNLNNSVLIECNNHRLTNGEIIYIEDTNSLPRINNKYAKSVKIIDKNIIELDINLKLLKDGDYGILYSIAKLEFDLYQTTNNISFEFKKTTYENPEINNNHNKIYLFDNVIVNKNDYDNIIKNIMPTLNQIVEYNLDKLNNSYTFNDVNRAIENYSININSFNIEQIKIIKNIFEKNLEKLINNPDDTKINLNLTKNSKKYFNDVTYFLSNMYITDKSIEELYGKYIHLNTAEDNTLLRLKWVQSQKDNGDIYYLNFLLLNKDKIDPSYLSTKINELSSLLKTLEINFKKEQNISSKVSKLYRYQAYIITEKDAEDGFKNLKNTLLDDTVVFYENNLYIWKGKLVEFKNIDENTLALVGNKIWVWKEGKWNKSDAEPKYENIKYLCELNNLDLSTIKLDSLDCIYRKDLGCHSKLYIRLNDNIAKITEYVNNFQKLSKNENKKTILDKINILKNKYYRSISKKHINNNEIILNVINEKEINIDKLSIVLNLIKLMDDYYKKLNYIYVLIEKDGLLIGNDIYSKKYKRKIPICSHYYYARKIEYADNPDEKVKLINDLLNNYSDSGETEKNLHVCTVCGEFLMNNTYDETEGFTESGMLKSSRQLWEAEKVDISTETFNLSEYIKKVTLDDKNLRDILLKYGLSIDNIDEAISISIFIINNLYPKAGVKLPNLELINMIIDCLQKIKNIIPYSYYKAKEIKKLEEKGYSKIDIEKVDAKNIFKVGYDRYSKIKRSSIIIARYLITVQTTIPPLVRSSKSTICPFYSFDGDEGINYMACILDEMQIVILKDDKIKKMEIFKTSISETYNDFKILTHIKELFIEKNKYLENSFKKADDFKLQNENVQENYSNLVEPIEIGYEYNKLILEIKDISTIRKMQNVLINRLTFLAKNIKKITKDVIAISPLTDQIVGPLETSCCTEDADQFLDYYFFIELQSSYPIKKNIDESNAIFGYTNYFINIGSIHRFLYYDKNKFDGIYNNPIVDDEIHTSQDLIKAVFEYFVDSGSYAGTLREYIGDIDIKSGLTRNQILSKSYTILEYQALLRNIEKYNIKYYTNYRKEVFEKSALDKLKKDSIEKLDKGINNLVKNVGNVLNKDKNFIQKYIDLFRNFGIFSNSDSANLSEKDKIKNRESVNKKKLDYIKKFYITKLKKYLSIIVNNVKKTEKNINLGFIGSTDIEKELQSDIYKDNNKLEPFLNENIRKYFLDLKIDFTNEEINSINGMDNIYDSKFEKIKEYSNFNFNDASNVLLYMLVSQLNNFIFCDFDENNDTFNNINSKNVKCRTICNFIMILFEELDSDNELFNLCEEGSRGIENSLIHERIVFKTKQFSKKDSDDYFTTMMQRKFSKQSKVEDDLEPTEELSIEEQEKIDFIMDKGKKELFEKYGYKPSEDQLETYKDDYLKNMEDEIMFNEEVYNLDTTAKGKDVIDQGSGYGEFSEFDFEDGDGFDYASEMVE